jgi:hypothetical protein
MAVYVEFPVDPIVRVHWADDDGSGSGGGGDNTHPCPGPSYTFTGTFRISNSSEWIGVGIVAGVDPNDPEVIHGTPIEGTVTVGGGSKDGHVVYPTLGPPMISKRPAYTNHACGFDVGVSSDGHSFEVIGSTVDVDVAEGDFGSFPSATLSFGPAPLGTLLYAGVRAHGGDMDSNVGFLLPFVGGGYSGVSVDVSYTCVGSRASEVHEHAPLIPDDQLAAAGLTRVTA